MTSGRAPPSSSLVDSRRTSVAGTWMTRALAVVLGAYALYSGWTLLYNVNAIAVASAGVCASAAVGLWRMRPWSRWIVYGLSAVVGLWFVWYVSRLVRSGWPYEDWTRSLAAVLPASVLLLCGLAAAAHVGRFFKLR